jgi:hypothetical protein
MTGDSASPAADPPGWGPLAPPPRPGARAHGAKSPLGSCKSARITAVRRRNAAAEGPVSPRMTYCAVHNELIGPAGDQLPRAALRLYRNSSFRPQFWTIRRSMRDGPPLNFRGRREVNRRMALDDIGDGCQRTNRRGSSRVAASCGRPNGRSFERAFEMLFSRSSRGGTHCGSGAATSGSDAGSRDRTDAWIIVNLGRRSTANPRPTC